FWNTDRFTLNVSCLYRAVRHQGKQYVSIIPIVHNVHQGYGHVSGWLRTQFLLEQSQCNSIMLGWCYSQLSILIEITGTEIRPTCCVSITKHQAFRPSARPSTVICNSYIMNELI